MVKTVVRGRRHVVAVRNSTQMLFSQLRFKNDGFISE